MVRTFILALSTLLLLPSPTAQAQLVVDTGVHSSVEWIMAGIVNVLLFWSGFVALALFLIGAILMVSSGGHDASVAAGKKIMKAAVIGLAFVLASWLILSTVIAFIYL